MSKNDLNSLNDKEREEAETNALMAFLYPDELLEEPPDSMKSAIADEISSYSSLQGVFRALPEEEPDHSTSTKLLALAAQYAPRVKKQKLGLKEKIFSFFSFLFFHPGLAAVATLILFVGIVGTLYLKEGFQIEEPSIHGQSTAKNQMDRNTYSVGKESAESKAKIGSEETLSDDLVGGQNSKKSRKAPASEQNSEKSRKAPASQPKPKKSRKRSVSEERSAGAGKALGVGRLSDVVPRKRARKGKEAYESKMSRPTPSSLSTASDSKQGNGFIEGEAEELDTDKQFSKDEPSVIKNDTNPAESSKKMHREARKASKSGRCKLMWRLVSKIRNQDQAYYQKNVTGDAILKECSQQ